MKIKQSLEDLTANFVTNGEEIDTISRNDAEISTIFIQLINKLGASKTLSRMLEVYKEIPDHQFLSMMEEYNENFVGDFEKKVMINISDKFIGELALIYSFHKYTPYNFTTKRTENILLINKSENIKTPYANTQIKFDNEQDLEREFTKIKEKLSDHQKIIFV